jgi:phage-related protein
LDTLTFVPSESTVVRVQPRVLRAQFGDGYAQEAQDGESSILRDWELVYDPIPATSNEGPSPTMEEVDAFFSAQGGYRKFLWRPPSPYDTQGSQLFVCTNWSASFSQGKIRSVRANLSQRAL